MAALCNLGYQASGRICCIWQWDMPHQLSNGIQAGCDVCTLRRLPHCVKLLLQGRQVHLHVCCALAGCCKCLLRHI
jgi:hypothetical protein